MVIERFWEDLSERDIAARHGVSRWKVREWLDQGLAQVRASLDRAHRGDRAAWMAVLAPWGRLDAGALTVKSGAAAAAAAGAAMGFKGAVVIAGIAAGFAAGWVVRDVTAPSKTAAVVAPPPPGDARTDTVPASRPPRAAPAAASAATPTAAAPAEPAPAPSVDPEVFLAAIEAALGWKEAWSVANDWVARPGGALALAAIHSRITDADKRAQVLKSVVFSCTLQMPPRQTPRCATSGGRARSRSRTCA